MINSHRNFNRFHKTHKKNPKIIEIPKNQRKSMIPNKIYKIHSHFPQIIEILKNCQQSQIFPKLLRSHKNH